MSDRAVEGVLVSDHLCDTARRRRGFHGVGDGGSQCVEGGGYRSLALSVCYLIGYASSSLS
jgi:hypothetical protein